MANERGRNIVICLDGTGVKFREDTTNVVKLYRVLDRSPSLQVAYYDPGVGTLGDPDYKTPLGKNMTRILGLAFGWGIIRNIEKAYSFLMEHYQEGDRIFIFGFSRGAYTARALAAFIHCFGILDSGCQNLIPYAMELFRSRPPNFEIMSKFKRTYGRQSTIHFLGLWDTVKSFGWIYDPIFLPYTTNNPSINIVRHAIAIDERRYFFQAMLWGSRIQAQNVKQVWFAGVHGDVGGGHPERQSGLAKVPLNWMICEAHNAELYINEKDYTASILGKDSDQYIAPNPLAELHNSLVGAWKPLQYIPRVRWDVQQQKTILQCPKRIRTIPDKSMLHQSVLERLESGSYQPPNLGLRTYEPSHVKEALLEKEYVLESTLAIS